MRRPASPHRVGLPVSAETELPSHLQTFLRQHIETYEQLEVLLLLRERADPGWDVRAIANQLRLAESAVRDALVALQGKGLVTGGLEPGTGAEYARGREHVDQIVAELIDTYATRTLEVMRAMTANSIARLRANAAGTFDAVLSGQKKDDG